MFFFRFKQSLHFTKEISAKMDEALPGLDANLFTRHRATKPRPRARDSTEKLKRNSVTEDDKSPSKKSNVTENNRNLLKTTANVPNIDTGVSRNLNQEMLPNIEIKREPCDTPNVKQEPIEYGEVTDNENVTEMIVDSDNEELDNSGFDNLCGDGDSNSSSNSPFIPPAASRKVPLSINKPPSEIFLQELDKFITTTLKGGCLCLAEFKEILELRQQGIFFYFFTF